MVGAGSGAAAAERARTGASAAADSEPGSGRLTKRSARSSRSSAAAAKAAARRGRRACRRPAPSAPSPCQPTSSLVGTVDAARSYTQLRGPPGPQRLPPRPTDFRPGCRGMLQPIPARQSECCSSSATASPLAAALRAMNNASYSPSLASPLFMYTPGAAAPREPLVVRAGYRQGPRLLSATSSAASSVMSASFRAW